MQALPPAVFQVAIVTSSLERFAAGSCASGNWTHEEQLVNDAMPKQVKLPTYEFPLSTSFLRMVASSSRA